ncbi:hypothetical protein HB780_06040 (plasmid) [Rhizobium lusitanum]|uniref:hypothetical protein n=1 Tax=Rhizobium lusitanum TaxID=293958 RepID=UPI001617C93C|nr:hypothetical protein [Rhizobium lusitanum]QND45309.1 hypothetical protein HB780_06040 [Rhizobium lusitanum]
MAAKKGDAADQVEKFSVVLLKPARIDGVKRMPDEIVDVSATVLEQLEDAEAVEPRAKEAAESEQQV